MKTKILIEELQKLDPTGEEEVCVGNEDIFFVSREPAYYDGCLQVLKRDPSMKPCYDITGLEYRSSGTKIAIHTYSVTDALYDDTDFEVTYESDYAERHNKDTVEKIRSIACEEESND